jgi:hypothetical protein
MGTSVVGCRLEFVAPTFCEVLPTRIHGFDESDLLAAPPALDFFFTIDGGIGIEEPFVIDKGREVVAAGESRNAFIFVLPDAMRQIAGDSDVEDGGLRTVGQDVNEELFRRAHGDSFNSEIIELSVTGERNSTEGDPSPRW